MGAWLTSLNLPHTLAVAKDDKKAIEKKLLKSLPAVDVIMTSGGAWGSERDLVVGVFDQLGWKKIFHHVRMGPGKGVVFGIWEGKPVFCLPGGPASNEMAFLQFALPGYPAWPEKKGILSKVSLPGSQRPWLVVTVPGRNSKTPSSCVIRGKLYGDPVQERKPPAIHCPRQRPDLYSEGRVSLKAGHVIPVQVLTPFQSKEET